MRKYVFLGDSLIYGYGVSPRDNWVYKLKNTLNLNLYNKGVEILEGLNQIKFSKWFKVFFYKKLRFFSVWNSIFALWNYW